MLFRVCQSSRDTAAQLTVALISAGHVPWLTINVLTSQANTNNPTPPIAAPAASTPAAFRPRAKSVEAGALFIILLFMLFDQCRARRKDRGKSLEEAANPGAEFLGR